MAVPLGGLPADLLRQTGAFALLTAAWALARPLGAARPWPVHWSAAAIGAAALAAAMEWTVPSTLPGSGHDPAAVVRRFTGVLLALAVGQAAAPTAQREQALAWAWRTVLVILGPPAVALAVSPSFANRLLFLVPVLPGVEIRADHVAHFVGALVLTVALMQSRLLGLSRGVAGQTLAVGLMLLAGPIIELIQGQIGRGQDLADCLWHLLGVLVAAAVVAAGDPLARWLRRR